jgi:hypothetical protein
MLFARLFACAGHACRFCYRFQAGGVARAEGSE